MKDHTNNNLPAGYSTRSIKNDDVEVLVDLFNASSMKIYGTLNTDIEDMSSEFDSPDINLEKDTRVVLGDDGQIKGGIIVFAEPDLPVHPFLWGYVHPDFEGKGLGNYLLAWAEERASEHLEKLPGDVRVSVRLSTRQGYSPAEKLFISRGYQLFRKSFLMKISLEKEPVVPEAPAGFTFRPIDPERDAEMAYRVQDDAFQDHFGHVEETFENGFPIFKHFFIEAAHFDPNVWIIAEEGDEMVAVLIGRKDSLEDPESGHVSVLGVRKPWRGRGLAGYMLKKSFAEFYKRGKKSVTLNVDGESLTGAVRLYEKVGMKIESCYDRYEKELRPGKEISTVSLEIEETEETAA